MGLSVLLDSVAEEDLASFSAKLQMLSVPINANCISAFTGRPQAELMQISDHKVGRSLYVEAAANDKDRLDALRRPHAGAWLAAFPCKALGLWIPSLQFKVSVRLCLGLASQQDAKALRKTGKEMYGCHHAIRDALCIKTCTQTPLYTYSSLVLMLLV